MTAERPPKAESEGSIVSRDPLASKFERMADKACNPIIVLNYLLDHDYSPYCLRCDGFNRMRLVEPFLWSHECGAVHDERQVLS